MVIDVFTNGPAYVFTPDFGMDGENHASVVYFGKLDHGLNGIGSSVTEPDSTKKEIGIGSGVKELDSGSKEIVDSNLCK